MSEKIKKYPFVYKCELAERYTICLNTFNVWLEKVKHKIPLYIEKQRRFSPSQVKFLDSVFVYNPNQIEMELEF